MKISAVRSALFVVIAGVVPIWPALWNGFPLIFPDSAGYIGDGMRLTTDLPRSMGYALFIRPFVQWGELWGVVVAQSLMAVMVLWIAGVAFGAMETGADLLVIVAALALASSLSWTVSWVMPDLFSGLMILSLAALVAFEQQRANRWRWLLVALSSAFAILHPSNILVLGIVVGALALVAMAQRLAARQVRIHASTVATMVGVGMMSLLGSVVMNAVTIGGISVFSPHGINLVLANLVEDGHLRDYLRAHCPDRNIRLCDHADSLSMDATTFLWASDSPFNRLGGFARMDDEAQTLVIGVVTWRPVSVLSTVTANFLEQLVMLDVRNDMKFASGNPHVRPIMERHRIRWLDSYAVALQHRAGFPSAIVVRLHQVATLIGLVAIALFLSMHRARVGRSASCALSVVLLSILANALVSGALSVPQDRYSARVLWLIPACAIMLWWPLRRQVRSALPLGE